jgi:nitrite reductase/ring-hydroxylating ferredoxin subunit/uncharacterized membrane protein
VHMPIALFTISVLLDVMSFMSRFAHIAYRAAVYTLALGVATALLAAIPGLVDYLDIRRDHRARNTATLHMILNLIAVAIFAANLALRWNDLHTPRVPPIAFALSLIGVAIIFYSGYLGGILVYDDGIAVGRHRRVGKTPQKTLHPRGEGLVEVADEADLAEGQTLRARVNGTVIAIAKSAGKIYAFQEFCTHRFGPLSEGALDGETITCPWHRSCFNMKTGEVINGPAKLEIKVFEVVVKDGRISVRL